MKTLNPLSKRFYTSAGVFCAMMAAQAVVDLFVQLSSIRSSFYYLNREFPQGMDVQEHVLFELSRTLMSYANLSMLKVGAFGAMLCMLFHLEHKQLYPGFLNVLPVRRRDFFHWATTLGFAFMLAATAVTGLVLAALMIYARPLLAFANAGPTFGNHVAAYFFSRGAMTLCFYALCLLCQQLLNKPAVAAAVACICAFVPQLGISFADKIVFALGYRELSRILGQYARVVLSYLPDQYQTFRLYFTIQSGQAAPVAFLFTGGLYLALAAVFYVAARRFAPRAAAYAVGLYGFAWVKPVLMVGFAVCTAAMFANFLPRFMGIDIADYPLLLMLELFGLGLASGYYAYSRAAVLLEN